MARKVRYHVSMDIVINESELALLRLIERRTLSSRGPTAFAARSFSSELDLSLATVRRSCRTLVEKGLLFVHDERRADGGRAANAYEITRLGHEVLHREGVMRPQRMPAPKPLPRKPPRP